MITSDRESMRQYSRSESNGRSGLTSDHEAWAEGSPFLICLGAGVGVDVRRQNRKKQLVSNTKSQTGPVVAKISE